MLESHYHCCVIQSLESQATLVGEKHQQGRESCIHFCFLWVVSPNWWGNLGKIGIDGGQTWVCPPFWWVIPCFWWVARGKRWVVRP